MGVKNSPAAAATALARLKREDCGRTKHDSAFSGWKVLVGPSDWEDFSLGKEGAERYRVHNLPRIFSPGIYELGIAVSHAKSGRQISKLDPSYIIVVYLGQADCVRTRLQQYGRSGAHLGRDSSTVCPSNCKSSCSHKRLGLFEEILCRGYSVVFRWAPMNNKEDALRTEAQLLNTFDYAWNKGCNNARRPTDILQKLDQVASRSIHISTITRKFLPFLEKKVGIEIKGKLISCPGNKDKPPADEESNFLYRIFRVSRTRPRVVVIDGSSLNKDSDSTHLCGVSLGNGAICRNPPLKGRKRCLDHKGLKINAHFRSEIPSGKKDYNDCETSDVFSPVCGFILGNGSSCQNPSTQGRKRCSDHKGQRIRKPEPHNSKLKDPDFDASYDVGKSENLVFLQQCKGEMNNGAICGVQFGDGTYCMRQPVKGRVRCEGHKGMRVNRVKKYTISR